MERWQPFERVVQEYMKRENIPGVSVAVLKKGEMIYQKGFGFANINRQVKSSAHTIYGIASITKSFTALMIMRLVEAGKLTVKDPVKKHLPDFELKDYKDIEAIKIHHLLSHTTGIPTFERKEALPTFEAHLNYLRSVPIKPIGKPGKYFCYNNDLFLLLGAIIEKITGRNYKEVIDEEIFVPNGMTRTTFHVGELEHFDDVSTPYQLEDGELSQCEWPTLGNYAVGGGIRSSAVDLLKYGALYLKQRNAMSEAVHLVNGKSYYGYGLQTTPDYSGRTLIEHGGSQPGVSSNFGFVPEEDLVVAVLTNVNGASAGNIWLHAVNTACGIRMQQQRYIEPHYHLKEQDLKKFVGRYETGEGAEIDIGLVVGELQATIDQKKYKLRASNERTLVAQPIEKPLRFYFDENEQSWAVFYGLRMFLKGNE